LRPRGVGQRPRQEGFERDQVGHEQRAGVQRRAEEQHEKHPRHRYGLRRHDAEDHVLTRPRSGRLVLVGIDTGGTFTDVVALVGGRIRVAKIRSTPEDPSRAVGEGLRALGVAPRSARLHYGTTVATNALLERRGARVVLVTTAGFEDVIEIGRQVRPSLYALEPCRPPPLVPRARRIGVEERMLADGRVERPPERRAVARLADAVLRHRPAGGVVGATAAARRAGLGPIVTLDMGGTSTDVSLVDGPLAYRTETSVDGLPVRVPALDIHTVGAGGGSLARLDPGGALLVGPE